MITCGTSRRQGVGRLVQRTSPSMSESRGLRIHHAPEVSSLEDSIHVGATGRKGFLMQSAISLPVRMPVARTDPPRAVRGSATCCAARCLTRRRAPPSRHCREPSADRHDARRSQRAHGAEPLPALPCPDQRAGLGTGRPAAAACSTTRPSSRATHAAPTAAGRAAPDGSVSSACERRVHGAVDGVVPA